MNTKTISVILWAVILIIVGFSVYGLGEKRLRGSTYSSGSTNTSVVIGNSINTTTSTIKATGGGQLEFLSICNVGAINAVTICLNDTTCSYQKGITLDARGLATSTKVCQIWEINPPGGAILGAISSTSTTSTIEMIYR